jgi:Catalase
MAPATDWKEIIPDGEPERLERYAEQLRELQRKRAKKGAPLRALHAKGQLGLEAEFTVLGDLPEHARVGLFAKPGTFRAYVRFSNGLGTRESDRKGDVRGIALKLVGVEGKKIIPGLEGATTQDFLLIQSAATPFRDADEFVWFVRAAAQPALLLPRLIGRYGFGGFGLLRKLLKGISKPVPSLATSRYYSALPIKLGPYAIHYALVPHASDAPGAKKGNTPDYLGEELSARLEAGPVTYDFRVQFFVDEARTPIEDASREWLEADAPFVTLARLTLGKQSTVSARGKRVAEFVEKLSFDPWHATEDFRPLGNMMRARNHAYRLSTQERKAAAEPDGTEQLG